MEIGKNKVVAITYELVVDGQIADKCTKERPLEYIHGTHCLLEKFEAELEGKQAGETFAFTLSPEEGYGTHNPDLVIQLPLEVFRDEAGALREEFLQVGASVPLVNERGMVQVGTVTSVSDSSVGVDLNPPMAGKTLHFTGEVVSIREATQQELEEGLHGEKAGCKGGCCGKGKGEGCGEGCGKDKGEGCCGKGNGEGCCEK